MRGRAPRWMLLSIAATVVVGVVVVGGSAAAHECTTDPDTGEETCGPTPVYPNWRPQYVPLFGANDTRCETEECKENRRDQQRWRDENGCENQYCSWNDVNTSVDDGSPMSVHAGMAADHSMFEAAHSSEGHGTDEGNHDTHGGSVFADICVGSDAGTSYEGHSGACEDPSDTQIGANIIDHNPCGVPPPTLPVPCFDEYHVVRPLDSAYTMEQMEESQEQIGQILDDPGTYLCGYAGVASQDPICDRIRPTG
jgi:hypothetical protein